MHQKTWCTKILVHQKNLVHQKIPSAPQWAMDRALPSSHNPTNFGYGNYGVQGFVGGYRSVQLGSGPNLQRVGSYLDQSSYSIPVVFHQYRVYQL